MIEELLEDLTNQRDTLLASCKELIETNAGPITTRSKVDRALYVLVRREAFEKIETAVKEITES